jgi:putative membrane protein insertion efficiency factor
MFKKKFYQFFFAALRQINHLIFPVHACRFSPTCSRYVEECFQTLSFHRALFLSIGRVLRCHFWREGGFDSVFKK